MTSEKTDGKDFLPHLSDPFRRQVAIQYVQHEWRKLFPSLRGQELWQSIDAQIADWYKMLSIRNFWNAIHGITIGFRLTSIVPWITSLHLNWSEREVTLDELWFRGKFGPIAELEAGTPDSAIAVKEAIFKPENRDFVEKTKQYFEAHKNDTEPRSDFPIFVVRKEGRLRVIDGNGRTLKAIVEGKNAIRAMVGELTRAPAFYEHWVPTSLLVDLVFWHEQQAQAGRDTTDTVARTVAELIRDSSAGRVEFMNRALHRDNEIHVRLQKRVIDIMSEYGVPLN